LEAPNANCLSNSCGANCEEYSGCHNSTKDGPETGTDCGWACIFKCGASQACIDGRDCTSNICNAGICS
jgi:hypothetical protein